MACGSPSRVCTVAQGSEWRSAIRCSWCSTVMTTAATVLAAMVVAWALTVRRGGGGQLFEAAAVEVGVDVR